MLLCLHEANAAFDEPVGGEALATTSVRQPIGSTSPPMKQLGNDSWRPWSEHAPRYAIDSRSCGES
jgi:hypothetical protein